MNALKEYIEVAEPIRDIMKVRFEIEKKAQEYADKVCPIGTKENEQAATSYLNGMFDTLELIYH